MLSLLKRPAPPRNDEKIREAKELFTSGMFPVVTTEDMPHKEIRKVIGLAAFQIGRAHV